MLVQEYAMDEEHEVLHRDFLSQRQKREGKICCRKRSFYPVPKCPRMRPFIIIALAIRYIRKMHVSILFNLARRSLKIQSNATHPKSNVYCLGWQTLLLGLKLGPFEGQPRTLNGYPIDAPWYSSTHQTVRSMT